MTLTLTANAPAKLNLFFEVLGKRTDGFHEISSVAVPISLGVMDTLSLTPRDDGVFQLRCYGKLSADVPTDDRNLVMKALLAAKRYWDLPASCGADVVLWKRIPSQAGLGGGSSDAATSLRLAAAAWCPNVSNAARADAAAAVGSDVSLFLFGGASVSRGRGELVKSLPPFPRLDGVVWKPPEGLSTASVYHESMNHHDNILREVDEFITAIYGDYATPAVLATQWFNRLESPAWRLEPRLAFYAERLRDCGGIGVRMSGSGTALWTLASHPLHACRVAARVNALGLGEAFTFTTLTQLLPIHRCCTAPTAPFELAVAVERPVK